MLNSPRSAVPSRYFRKDTGFIPSGLPVRHRAICGTTGYSIRHTRTEHDGRKLRSVPFPRSHEFSDESFRMKRDSETLCEDCGQPISGDSEEGCTYCLLQLAFGTGGAGSRAGSRHESAAQPAYGNHLVSAVERFIKQGVLPQFGDYELESEIARGSIIRRSCRSTRSASSKRSTSSA